MIRPGILITWTPYVRFWRQSSLISSIRVRSYSREGRYEQELSYFTLIFSHTLGRPRFIIRCLSTDPILTDRKALAAQPWSTPSLTALFLWRTSLCCAMFLSSNLSKSSRCPSPSHPPFFTLHSHMISLLYVHSSFLLPLSLQGQFFPLLCSGLGAKSWRMQDISRMDLN